MNVVLVHGLNHRQDAYFFPWLEAECVARGLNVIKPEFPNLLENNEVYYETWSKIFSKDIKEIDLKNTIVIAHSLGSVFSVRYFTENNLQIYSYVALAGSQKTRTKIDSEQLNNFWPNDEECALFAKLAKHRYALYSNSDDDNYFFTKDMKDFANKIKAEKYPVENAGHFRSEEVCKKELMQILDKMI